ncbi:MAG: hypothetical protein CMJ32_10950 [Phycisphaerae bacterium]|nr:hypothetical protein [Phycisphaerae bacterium]
MNIGKVVRDAVGQVAPSVGQALGGPAGGFVGRQVSQVLTGRPDASEDALRAAVAEMTPEQVASLEAIELQLTERERIAAGDRADARDRQQVSNDQTPARLAYLNLGLLAAVIAALLAMSFWSIDPPQTVLSVVTMLIGALLARNEQIGNFFFGSTTDSRRKTGLLAGRRG